MKKLGILVFLVLISFFLVLQSSASATPFATMEVTGIAYKSYPTAQMTFPNLPAGTYYTGYDLSTNEYGLLQGFCIEDVYAPSTFPALYELWTIQAAGLAQLVDPTRLLQAAYLAEKYLASERAAAQVAIWNLAIDSDDSVSASNGTVYSTSSFVSRANDMLTEVKALQEYQDYGWVIARTPVSGSNGTDKQDYLVKVPVPEPATMLLLGSGLIGLAVAGRRKFFKK